MEKKEITLEDILKLTGPAQLITVTEESRLMEREKGPIYSGRRVRLTKGAEYQEGLKGRAVKHISTASDDVRIQEGKAPERGIFIVLW